MQQPLTVRQHRFVAEFAVCGNGAEAARRAGYSARTARQIASENLSKPDIQAAIDSLRQQEAAKLELRKDQIIAAIMDAISMAKMKAEPSAMIRGLVEIAKMLGYYEPERVKIDLTDDAKRMAAKYAVMSDEELLAIMEGTESAA